jgi:hypothetical protein
MSNLNEEDISVILKDSFKILDYRLRDGYWEMLVDDRIPMTGDNKSVPDWRYCSIIEVPKENLLKEWSWLIHELSSKEIQYYKLRERYLLAEQELVNTVDFKALYGKNNADVRKAHCKKELASVITELKELEWSINWIKSYIPLLKEVIRCK